MDKKIRELKPIDLINIYNIIGYGYLQGEQAYLNTTNGLLELQTDYQLTQEELLDLTINNKNYNPLNEYIIYNGNTLDTVNKEYLTINIQKKMNGETKEYLNNIIL